MTDPILQKAIDDAPCALFFPELPPEHAAALRDALKAIEGKEHQKLTVILPSERFYVSRVNEVDALHDEIRRLTPQPDPVVDGEKFYGPLYRSGPRTAELYTEIAGDMALAAKDMKAGGSAHSCSVCGDSGHWVGDGCHHDALYVARKWIRATSIYVCWHCGYVATSEAEANAHFGEGPQDEDHTPVCNPTDNRSLYFALRARLAEAETALMQIGRMDKLTPTEADGALRVDQKGVLSADKVQKIVASYRDKHYPSAPG